MYNKKDGLKIKKTKEIEIFLFPRKISLIGPNQIVIYDKEGNIYNLNYQYEKKNKSIRIQDINIPIGHRKGYGTILLKNLFKIIKKEFKTVKLVYGLLSYDDENHKIIQKNFYEKNGFKVDDYLTKKEINNENLLKKISKKIKTIKKKTK